MTVNEMREWAQAGNEVGSHTLDHVHLPELAPDEARRQIVESRMNWNKRWARRLPRFATPMATTAPSIAPWPARPATTTPR